MNGANKPVFRSPTLDAVERWHEAMPPGAWRWIAIGQLWMLAGFTGLSLLVIALLSLFHGGAGHGRDELLATGFAGTLLLALAWRGMKTVLRHAEGGDPRGPGLGARQASPRRVSTSPVPTPPGRTPARATLAPL